MSKLRNFAPMIFGRASRGTIAVVLPPGRQTVDRCQECSKQWSPPGGSSGQIQCLVWPPRTAQSRLVTGSCCKPYSF